MGTFTPGSLQLPPFRYAQVEISSQSLERISRLLKERGTTFLELTTDLYGTLGSSCMVWGLDAYSSTLVRFLDGDLSQEEVREDIRAAAFAHPRSLALLERIGGKCVTVSGLTVVTRALVNWE